ncbi:MAG: hypothetical protein ACP5HQ_07230 [Thermoprotei archaeon]
MIERAIKVLAVSSGLVILFVILGPLAPVNERLVGVTPDGLISLAPPVYLSFSAFLALITFLATTVLFWGSRRQSLNLLIEGSGFAFVALNYLNFFAVYRYWEPQMQVVPFFIVVTYHNAGTIVSSLNFDFGQLVLLILVAKYLTEWRRKRVEERRKFEPMIGTEGVQGG